MSGLYSPINKLMEQVTRPKGTGAEYMAELSKKPGYKPAEAEDRDLQALMALPQMERAAFMEKLKGQANKYPLKMRELGEGQTYHETYTLPGGENYREILLHTPDTKREELKKKLGEIGDMMASPGLPSDQYKKLYATRAALADQYTHGTEGSFGGNPAHFGGAPNILASVRVKDRTSPEGKKILHIEEIQSDWHQQGREYGYHPKDLYAQIRAAKAEKKMMDRYLKEADEDSGDMAYGEYGRMVDDHQAATEKLDRLEQLKEEGVPHGPHAKDWHELALKAMIQHAAENGYDQIVITPGAEQAKRFGLSKHVGSVSYNPETQHFQAFKPNRETITNEKGATPERVKALIGKEAAEKLMQAPKQMGHHYLEGEGLDMGGEGMKGFYDKMVPTFLNKFGKKHGVQVQSGSMPIVSTPAQHHGLTEEQFQAQSPDEQQRMVRQHAYAYQGAKTEAPVHTFDITPAMREDVLKNGIPRYADGGEVEVRPTVKDEAIQRKVPEMEAAAKALQAGAITRKDYDKVVQQHKPVKPYTFVPKPASDADAARALMENKKPQWRGHEQWPAGRKVGLRLDIPAYEHHGVWVNSVHDEEGSGKDKYPTAYHSVSSVKNATFDASPDKAVRVATGEQNKSPFARIKGELHHITEDEAVEHMKQHLNHPEWAQVGMDPRRHGFFYDRKTLKPVTHSEHVVQIGPLVLAKNPKYGKRESYADGGDVSRETNLAEFLEPSKEKRRMYHGTRHYTRGVAGGHPVTSPEADPNYTEKMRSTGGFKSITPGIRGMSFVTPDTEFANEYAGESKASNKMSGAVYPVHVQVKNPFDYENSAHVRALAKLLKPTDNKWAMHYGKNPKQIHDRLASGAWEYIEDPDVQAAAKKLGHDAMYMSEHGVKNLGVFNPNAIKSATGNRGTYDINEPDMTKAEGGSIKPVGNAVVKEKVTISPNMDAMQYELMGVKHFTKKVK